MILTGPEIGYALDMPRPATYAGRSKLIANLLIENQLAPLP
jgi:hypothetical protein